MLILLHSTILETQNSSKEQFYDAQDCELPGREAQLISVKSMRHLSFKG